MVLDNPTKPKPEDCSYPEGKILSLTEDGNEAFCMCDQKHTGENCIEKIPPMVNTADFPQLEVWKKKLKVPGMFDLMHAIEESTEKIIDHVTVVR